MGDLPILSQDPVLWWWLDDGPVLEDTTEEFSHGDRVRVEGRPEYKQPYTVEVQYHTGAYRLADRFGAPLIGVDGDRLEAVDE